MAEKNLETGTVVKLKSGGPVMTVDHYERNASGNTAYVVCIWFVGDAFSKNTFHQDSLMKLN
jgi:uncharacterized protein YodC (DUF2158 family)